MPDNIPQAPTDSEPDDTEAHRMHRGGDSLDSFEPAGHSGRRPRNDDDDVEAHAFKK